MVKTFYIFTINRSRPSLGECYKYIKDDLKLNETDEDKYFFSEYNAEALMDIIETQKRYLNIKRKITIKDYTRY